MTSMLSAIADRISRRLSDTVVIETNRYHIDGPSHSSFQRRQSVAAESFDPESADSEHMKEPIVVHPKSDEQRNRLTNAVKNILLFRCLDDEQKNSLIDAMEERRIEAGEMVITQGDDGDNFYVIESGTYHVYMRSPSHNPDELGEKIGSYEGEGSFGELALMYNTSRAASIKAATEGILWLMDRHTFRRIVLRAAFIKRHKYECLLDDVPLLKCLDPYERKRLADALQSRQYSDGATIISQGDLGKEMYFIESGNVRIACKDRLKEIELKRLGKGDYFGVLDVAGFERLMGPCIDFLKRNIDTYEKQMNDLMLADSLKVK